MWHLTQSRFNIKREREEEVKEWSRSGETVEFALLPITSQLGETVLEGCMTERTVA